MRGHEIIKANWKHVHPLPSSPTSHWAVKGTRGSSQFITLLCCSFPLIFLPAPSVLPTGCYLSPTDSVWPTGHSSSSPALLTWLCTMDPDLQEQCGPAWIPTGSSSPRPGPPKWAPLHGLQLQPRTCSCAEAFCGLSSPSELIHCCMWRSALCGVHRLQGNSLLVCVSWQFASPGHYSINCT